MTGLSRRVVFVAPHLKMGSARLRAVQISDELRFRGVESEVVPTCSEVKDSIIIIIKGEEISHVESARARNNIIVADLIDPHQKTFHRSAAKDPAIASRMHFHQVDPNLFDGLLFVNTDVKSRYKDWAPDVPQEVIPHPWDSRFIQPPVYHRNFSLVALGHSSDQVDLPLLNNMLLRNHVLTQEMIVEARNYACHLSLRQPGGKASPERFGRSEERYTSKSNIKVSTAAACGANIISSRDPGSTDVLPHDYPFWYDGQTSPQEHIEYVAEIFGSRTWKEGLAMMDGVREATSTSRVVDHYLAFFQNL